MVGNLYLSRKWRVVRLVSERGVVVAFAACEDLVVDRLCTVLVGFRICRVVLVLDPWVGLG